MNKGIPPYMLESTSLEKENTWGRFFFYVGVIIVSVGVFYVLVNYVRKSTEEAPILPEVIYQIEEGKDKVTCKWRNNTHWIECYVIEGHEYYRIMGNQARSLIHSENCPCRRTDK